jgi:transmembrane sensor
MRAQPLVVAAVLVAASGGGQTTYRFVEVKSKVVVEHAGSERRAGVGEVAVAGDGVRTGWLGRAVLEVADRAARFEILPSTRATLAGPEPGVLVVLERGRLKAFFDALTGNEERLVATPGALLAVRGTRYGVEVERGGAAAVAVFEGTVEVRPRDPAFPVVAVQAGELCRFGLKSPPRTGPLPRGTREQGWRGGLVQKPGPPGSPRGQSSAAPGPGGPRDPLRDSGASGRRPGGGRG